ncbi:wis1 [Candida pseudojiufengensis]|uniref:wis1 n=1 Tax=Candida pseudojiufengensis TaxID=497109 RepID=UPI0022243BBE|nr:wis1 [Candida pseudojiufengensis]KAI5961012.1 wis1 [Candida pseudojiufengensis]
MSHTNNNNSSKKDIETQFENFHLDEFSKSTPLSSKPSRNNSTSSTNSDKSTTTAQPPLASPPITSASTTNTSTVHTPINSDIQARLMAFQQKRSKPASEPLNVYKPNNTSKLSPALPDSNQLKAGVFNSDSLIETIHNHKSINGKELDISQKEITSSTNTSNLFSNPNSHPSIVPPQLNLPNRYPMSNRFASINGSNPQLNQQGPGSPQQISQKKPSLSQRRGMKLNTNALPLNSSSSPKTSALSSPSLQQPPQNTTGSLSSAINFESSALKSPGEDTPQSTNQLYANQIKPKLGTPNELSRRLSERKKKPNLKLNFDSSNSNLPSRNNSLSKNSTPGSINSDHSFDSSNNNSTIDSSNSEPQLQGLFANYSKYIDIKSGQLNFAGKASLHSKGIDFSSGSSFRVSLEEFECLDELGRGNYGSVSKVLHKPTGVLMAMKEVRLELDETKFTQILMELDILHKCDSPYIVDFYGAFFVEGAVYMCIEYMDGGSLDKIFGDNIGVKDETSLAYITESVIRGLKELKDNHNIIHRDVKPTNILVNSQGKVKLCDFGVSGNLVASLAKTNIGCQSYMAPERIKSLKPDDATYSVQSDIWSLGLTILELAVGHYPYPAETYDNIFSQLSAIVDGEPPKLDSTIYSKEAQFFVKSCLNKNPDLRPSYSALLQNPWLINSRGKEHHLDKMVQERIKELNQVKDGSSTTKKPNTNAADIPQNANKNESVNSLLKNKVKAPALHRGGLQKLNKNFLNSR